MSMIGLLLTACQHDYPASHQHNRSGRGSILVFIVGFILLLVSFRSSVLLGSLGFLIMLGAACSAFVHHAGQSGSPRFGGMGGAIRGHGVGEEWSEMRAACDRASATAADARSPSLSAVDAAHRCPDHASVCLAIDIGGTKLAAGLVDSHGVILAGHQVATPKDGDADRLFQEVAELVGVCSNEAETSWACRGCLRRRQRGPDGTPRAVDLAVEHPCVALLSSPGPLEALPTLAATPVFIDNDAKALALGEAWAGAAQGVENFLAMVVSTGIGGGIVLDGRLLDGRSGNAGHIGHIVVEPAGRTCACGSWGCLERRLPAQPSKKQPGARLPMLRPRSFSEPVCSSAGPLLRSRRYSICVWPSSAARWRSASGRRSSRQLSRKSMPGPESNMLGVA